MFSSDYPDFGIYLSLPFTTSENEHFRRNKSENTNVVCTSRPARVINTVPRPPAVSHFWVEKPSNSMNNETPATHAAV